MSIVRGASWMGLFIYYFAKMPGLVSVEIPALLFLMMISSRAIGVGAFAPLKAASKAVWITIRVFVDYLTDTDGAADAWYWAFCISMIWPSWNMARYFFPEKSSDSPRASQSSHAASGQSQCGVSSHSAIGSASRTASSGSGNCETGRDDVRASPRSADYLLLRGKSTNPMSLLVRPERNTRWARMHLNDVCVGRGEERRINSMGSNGLNYVVTTQSNTKNGFSRKHAHEQDDVTDDPAFVGMVTKYGCALFTWEGMMRRKSSLKTHPEDHRHSPHLKIRISRENSSRVKTWGYLRW